MSDQPGKPARRGDTALITATVIGAVSTSMFILMVAVIWAPFWLFGEERQLLLWYPALFIAALPAAGLLAAVVLAIVAACRQRTARSWITVGAACFVLVIAPALLILGGFGRLP